MDALKRFLNVYGLGANVDKSNVFMAESKWCATKILRITKFTGVSFPMRYLGQPLSPRKWTILDCHDIIMRVTKRIKDTATKHLSYVGRL